MLSLETIANDADNLISTIGYQEAAPRQDYPVRVIPKRYSFNMDTGRRLAEFQLVYITAGTGIFNDHSGSRVITPGTLFLLRPGYWHSYRPEQGHGMDGVLHRVQRTDFSRGGRQVFPRHERTD